MKQKTKKKTNKTVVENKLYLAVLMIIVLLIIATIIGIFTTNDSSHSNNTDYEQIFKSYQTDDNKLTGIDVSEHNGKINWNRIADGCDFAFIRVGYRGYKNGAIKADVTAKYNLKNANKEKIKVGVYFYSQATTTDEAIEEAKYAIKIASNHQIDLPIIIDFEYPTNSSGNLTGRLYEAKLSNNERTKIINAFCDEVTKKGYASGVYASTSVYNNLLNVKKINSDAMIWVADYNDGLTYSGDFNVWQFTETGCIDGTASKYVDLNYWYLND